MLANSTIDIEKYFGNLTNTEVGLMSVGNIVGNVFGTMLSAPLYTHLEPKTVLTVALIIQGLTQSVFSFSDIFWVVFPSRFIVGICQAI